MKLLTLCSALLISNAALAGIGDNFRQGGLEPTFSGYLWVNENASSLMIRPGLNYYIVDNVVIGGAFEYGFGSANGNTETNYFTLHANAAYTFGYEPLTNQGLAHRVGGDLSMGFNALDGIEYYATTVKPYYRLDYFVNEGLSAHVSLSAGQLQFAEGLDVWATNVGAVFGMSYHIPTSKRSIF